MDFDSLSDSEKAVFRKGQEIVVDEMLNAIDELEASRNPHSSHGKAQLYILRELVAKITEN
jgi:hypothetical protein